MKCKIVLFVEGRSELIFVYYLLFHIFSADDLIIKPYELLTPNNFSPPIVPEHKGQNPKIEFWILNVNGGELVLTKIKENAINWLDKNYTYVCGLRDMFSKTYDQLSKGKINPMVTKKY